MEVIGKFILNLIADGIATLIHDIFVALLTVIMDFVSNSVLMPIVAFFTAIFVGFIIKPKSISDEVRVTNGKFVGEKLFTVMIKWITPVFLILILGSSVANAMGWFKL